MKPKKFLIKFTAFILFCNQIVPNPVLAHELMREQEQEMRVKPVNENGGISSDSKSHSIEPLARFFTDEPLSRATRESRHQEDRDRNRHHSKAQSKEDRMINEILKEQLHLSPKDRSYKRMKEGLKEMLETMKEYEGEDFQDIKFVSVEKIHFSASRGDRDRTTGERFTFSTATGKWVFDISLRGRSAGKITRIERYDSRNFLIMEIDRKGVKTEYKYNAQDKLQEVRFTFRGKTMSVDWGGFGAAYGEGVYVEKVVKPAVLDLMKRGERERHLLLVEFKNNKNPDNNNDASGQVDFVLQGKDFSFSYAVTYYTVPNRELSGRIYIWNEPVLIAKVSSRPMKSVKVKLRAALNEVNGLLDQWKQYQDLLAIYSDLNSQWTELREKLNGRRVSLLGEAPSLFELDNPKEKIILEFKKFQDEMTKALKGGTLQEMSDILQRYNQYKQQGVNSGEFTYLPDGTSKPVQIPLIAYIQKFLADVLKNMPINITQSREALAKDQAAFDQRMAEQNQAVKTYMEDLKSQGVITGYVVEVDPVKGYFDRAEWPCKGSGCVVDTGSIRILRWIQPEFVTATFPDGSKLEIEFHNGLINPKTRDEVIAPRVAFQAGLNEVNSILDQWKQYQELDAILSDLSSQRSEIGKKLYTRTIHYGNFLLPIELDNPQDKIIFEFKKFQDEMTKALKGRTLREMSDILQSYNQYKQQGVNSGKNTYLPDGTSKPVEIPLISSIQKFLADALKNMPIGITQEREALAKELIAFDQRMADQNEKLKNYLEDLKNQGVITGYIIEVDPAKGYLGSAERVWPCISSSTNHCVQTLGMSYTQIWIQPAFVKATFPDGTKLDIEFRNRVMNPQTYEVIAPRMAFHKVLNEVNGILDHWKQYQELVATDTYLTAQLQALREKLNRKEVSGPDLKNIKGDEFEEQIIHKLEAFKGKLTEDFKRGTSWVIKDISYDDYKKRQEELRPDVSKDKSDTSKDNTIQYEEEVSVQLLAGGKMQMQFIEFFPMSYMQKFLAEGLQTLQASIHKTREDLANAQAAFDQQIAEQNQQQFSNPPAALAANQTEVFPIDPSPSAAKLSKPLGSPLPEAYSYRMPSLALPSLSQAVRDWWSNEQLKKKRLAFLSQRMRR